MMTQEQIEKYSTIPDPTESYFDKKLLERGRYLNAQMPVRVLQSVGTDYKLSVSFLVRPTHPWQWPVRTSTGWCLGRIGVHLKGSSKEILKA